MICQFCTSELLVDENNNLRKKGDIITNLKYAATLEIIRDNPTSFYQGPLADDIVRDLEVVKGIVTKEDLKNYKEIYRQPLESELKAMTMYLTPPPTSGAVLTLIFNILKGWLLSFQIQMIIPAKASILFSFQSNHENTNNIYSYRALSIGIPGGECFNPLRPNSDLSQTSHYNIKSVLVREVMRIENMITQVKFS